MNELLIKLAEKIKEDPKGCFFNGPAESELIRQVEELKAIILPTSFKEFLMRFNGGFISLFEYKEGRDIETLAWNSNQLLSLEEISGAMQRIEHKVSGLEVKFIPFLHTSGGYYLCFLNPLEGVESKVYDLWHEAPATEWLEQVVYDSFAELMEEYLKQNGKIETIG